MKLYKVRFMMDNEYEVIEIDVYVDGFARPASDYEYTEESVYQGKLSDCEAYIRLKEGGYM